MSSTPARWSRMSQPAPADAMSRSVRLRSLGAGVGICLALAACGGGPSPLPPTAPAGTAPATSAARAAATDATAATPPARDPCSLITPKEASAAVGGATLQDPVPAGNPAPDRCTWTAPPTDAIAQVEIGVGNGAKKSDDIDHDGLKHE